MRCSIARLTASRSSLFLIGLPAGISTGLLVDDAFIGDGGAFMILFFRSLGNRRGLELVPDWDSTSVTGWLDVWAISVRVSVACPPPLQCVGQPSSRRATGRTASVWLQTVGHPSICWATGSAANL